MTENRNKKIIVKVKKKRISNSKNNNRPISENILDKWDDYSRMYYYDDPWIKPWWNNWMINRPLGFSLEENIKFIPVDIIDTGKGYQIIAEMPGIDKRNIEVVVTSKNISICGETITNIKKENEGFVKKERGYSKLCRYLRFPDDVNPKGAEAILNNGILNININKKTPLKKDIVIPVK